MIMESTLTKLAVQVPDLVALIAIVILFLRSMRERDSLLRELHTEHIDSRKESRMIITRCVEVMGETVETMHNVAESIKQCTMRR
jgi:heme exporter protein D